MKYAVLLTCILVMGSSVGCSSPEGNDGDTGSGIDAAIGHDASGGCDRDSCVPDAGAGHDGGRDAAFVPVDVGCDPDCGFNDAGTDAATFADTGTDANTVTDAGSDGGRDAGLAQDAGPTGADGGCLAILGAMGQDCSPRSGGSCPAGFTCHDEPGFVLQQRCQILCDPSFACPCGTVCMMHDVKGSSWMQCDQL